MELFQSATVSENLEKSDESKMSIKNTTATNETESPSSFQSMLDTTNSTSDAELSDGDELPDLEAIWTPSKLLEFGGTYGCLLVKTREV